MEEACADFDAMLRHDWRRLGSSAEKVREFCVWRNAPMRVSSQGDLVFSVSSRRCPQARSRISWLCSNGAGLGCAPEA